MEVPHALQCPEAVGFRNVHLEHAHEVKSGLEGVAGVNRTDSPRTSMTSVLGPAPWRGSLQASQRPAEDTEGPEAAEHPGHFQEGGAGWLGLGSSSSSTLRRLIGSDKGRGLGLEAGPVEGEVGGGTSRLLRGTGLFCKEDKEGGRKWALLGGGDGV